VLAEMRRVCAPDGTVMVVDAAPAPDKADAFNRMEKLRDPSHARALPLDEHVRLFREADLPAPRHVSYRLEGELDGLLSRSFPNAGDAERLHELFTAAVTNDALDMQTRRDGDRIRFGYPVAVLAAQR
jgi:hypothetical protein